MNAPVERQASRSDWQREARRQQAFVAALFAPEAAPPLPAMRTLERGARWDAGLAAYRRNGLANSGAALRAQFPTVLAMLGGAAFDAVGARDWRATPPCRGDLAQIGAGFAQTLEQLPELDPWPWLADAARLDRALWEVMFEAPSRFAAADLQRLASGDPACLRLHLAPGTRLLRSRWNLPELRRLHAGAEPDADALRGVLEQPGGACWVWREGLQAQCIAVDAANAAWLRQLRQAPTLEAAEFPEGLDFDAWLSAAIRHGWLDRVEPLDNPGENS
jgi:hypothetical protein